MVFWGFWDLSLFPPRFNSIFTHTRCYHYEHHANISMMLIFRHKAGHHDTTVHEKVAPAVVQENVVKQRHEEATTAIDREIHQDHYHTSIQPVQDREVLPEKHHHRMGAVETREHVHGDTEAVKARLEKERLQFQDTRSQGSTQETHSVAPVIAGEHVHHHVHEVSKLDQCSKVITLT